MSRNLNRSVSRGMRMDPVQPRSQVKTTGDYLRLTVGRFLREAASRHDVREAIRMFCAALDATEPFMRPPSNPAAGQGAGSETDPNG